MTKDLDYYALLGLSKDATPDEVRRAYHEAARRLHPDVNREAGETELFLHVQEAYNVLSNRDKRNRYDQDLSQSPRSNRPVSHQVIYSHPSLLPLSEPQLIYSLVEFTITDPPEVKPSPPLNMCLVLDRSTSMYGERMDTVKASAIELVRQLRQEDNISIVAFSDRAEVLMGPGNHIKKSDAEAQIRMIQPGGGTEILRGLEAGLNEIQRGLSRKSINHLILLTDGRTYGDEADCLHLASQAAEQGIGITCLGIGDEWNDSFLDDLATRTGGRSIYISQLGDIHKLLEEKVRDLSQIYAEQTLFNFTLGPGVKLNYVYRLAPDATPLPCESPLRMGSIYHDSNLSVLLEFIVPPLPDQIQHFVLLSGEVTLEIPSLSNPTSRFNLRLTRAINSVSVAKPPPPAIYQALSSVNLYRLQDRARQDVTAGDVEGACRRLQHLATHLIAQGNRELARTVLLEAERIQQTHFFSEEGEKQIKYGTRALLLSGNHSEENEV